MAFSGVQAVDADNDVLFYTIEDSDYFNINQLTGEVIVARSLTDAPSK